MIKETLHYGPQEISADQEIEFASVDGMKTIIPYSRDWQNLIVQVSGGLDSALLLFLTAKALNELGSTTRITPLSLEVPTKVKNLASARKVIDTVAGITGYPYLQKGVEVIMPKEEAHPDRKNKFFSQVVQNLMRDLGGDFEFNGNTKNPPESVRQEFRDDEWREMTRDDRTTIYNWKSSASPHAFNDKRGIVFLYKKFGIVEALATHTLSCDIDLDEKIERNLPTPCGECWWCRERAWGFASNHIADPSLKPS